MATTTRRRVLAASVILAAALGTGCNVLSLPFFLFSPEPKKEAMLRRVSSDEKDKEVKLLLVAYNGLEIRPEFIQADRLLIELLSKRLKELFELNQEKVTIVSPRKVEEYKSNHPDWHKSLDPAQIGKHFEADYVAYLDINELGLFEKGSVNQMYRGRADITVTLVDVNKPDEDPDRKDFAHIFPSDTKGPIPVGDITLNQFRQLFLDSVARRLAWYFSAHPVDKDHMLD